MEESPSPPLPTDVATLQGMVRELLATVADLRKTVAAQQQRIDDLTRRLYGKKSERATDEDPAPGALPPPPATSPAAPPRRRRGHGRRPLPDHLPRGRVEYDLAEAVRACPCFGKERVRIGAELFGWLAGERDKVLPKSPMGVAIGTPWGTMQP